VLCRIREARNETLGVSPFIIVMGRNPGNPLSLIKESWSGVNPLTQPMGKTVTEYLTELQTNMKQIHDVAATHASQVQRKY